MPKRIYLDSNVFISLINREMGFSLRGLFIEAENFFIKVAEKKDVLVLSNLFFKEIKGVSFYEKDFVVAKLHDFNLNLDLIEDPVRFDIKKFLDLGLHGGDAVHVSIAVKTNCDLIVTFNLKHFLPVNKIIEVNSPNEY